MLSSLLLVKKRKDEITAILVFFLLKCQYMDPYTVTTMLQFEMGYF